MVERYTCAPPAFDLPTTAGRAIGTDDHGREVRRVVAAAATWERQEARYAACPAPVLTPAEFAECVAHGWITPTTGLPG